MRKWWSKFERLFYTTILLTKIELYKNHLLLSTHHLRTFCLFSGSALVGVGVCSALLTLSLYPWHMADRISEAFS
jgi:hypothetical protein